jgi:transcriptional regulator with XRE-family HTH domain
MTTEELTNKLKACKNVDDFMQEYHTEFDEDGFRNFLHDVLHQRGINVTTLAFESGVSVPYAYGLFNGRKSNPRKDVLLRLAFGLGLSLAETNRLLTLGGVSELRAKTRRDSIVIFCIEGKHTLEDTDELLHQYGLQTLL